MRNTFMPELNALERRVKKLCNIPSMRTDQRRAGEVGEHGDNSGGILKASDSQIMYSVKKLGVKSKQRSPGLETTRQVTKIPSMDSLGEES
jgi:hypothetical protein